MRGLTAAAVASAVLAVLSISAAAVIVLEPFGSGEADAASGNDGGAEETTAEEAGPTDLTEGLEPFDPYENDDYYGFTWHEMVWFPPMAEDVWEADYSPEGRSVTFENGGDESDWAYLNCSDTRHNAEHYPASIEDPEDWYQAELDREADFISEDDVFEVVSGPTYTQYVIDGRDAVLVEYARHWTQFESEGETEEVDYVRAHAVLFVDLPTEAATEDDPVNPARCALTSYAEDSPYYEDAVEQMLSVRVWLG